MDKKNEVLEQTNLAYDFLQKLFQECSYLVGEISGLLNNEEEKFIMGGGSNIYWRSSKGLDTNSIPYWAVRSFSVFYVPEIGAKIKGSQTKTEINSKLKVIYVQIILKDKSIKEPVVCAGVLHNLEKKYEKDKYPEKFENYMQHLQYHPLKIVYNTQNIDHEDQYMKFKGKFKKCNLYDINSSEDINNQIIKPVLKYYKEI